MSRRFTYPPPPSLALARLVAFRGGRSSGPLLSDFQDFGPTFFDPENHRKNDPFQSLQKSKKIDPRAPQGPILRDLGSIFLLFAEPKIIKKLWFLLYFHDLEHPKIDAKLRSIFLLEKTAPEHRFYQKVSIWGSQWDPLGTQMASHIGRHPPE